MLEVIAFDDAEALMVAYLKPLVSDATVSTKVPTTIPNKLVKVTRTGGQRIRLNADRAIITFQCWSKNSVDASNLAKIARAYVSASEGEVVAGNWIYKVGEVSGPQFFPDPETKTPVYQFTASIDIKGGPLT